MNREELLQAIAARHAVRAYLDTPIPAEVRAELDAAIIRVNAESGLSIKALYDEPEGFVGRQSHYGSFRNVRNYLALIAHTGTAFDTPCGYYGQQLVLLAQHLGLNSCWAGLSYNKKRVKAELDKEKEEVLALVVALGYGETAGRPHKSKPIEKLGGVRGGGPMPDWFRQGLEAASLAPSALNQQKFFFELDGTAVHASPGIGSYVKVDLGIAKFHFEAGADSPDWHWA